LKSSPIEAALRLRSFAVRQDVPLEITARPALVGVIVDMAERALPLLRFGWDAVDEVKASP